MSTDQNHPTVVIGAGLGGLCCGAFLARHGVPVMVIEQHNKPGGYATSFEREDGRFVFDVSLHGTSINNTGVRLSDGKVLPATAVVSNASAITTLTNLLPEGALPAEYREQISTYRPSVSNFIVWLGLNTELRGDVDAYSTHVSTRAGPEAEHEASLSGDYERTGFSVTVYDNAFEGYSRPGTSSVMLFCHSGWEPWRRFEGDYLTGDRAAYEAEKERWSESLIRRAEELVVPGLSSMIEVQVTASPLTNWAYTGNTAFSGGFRAARARGWWGWPAAAGRARATLGPVRAHRGGRPWISRIDRASSSR